MHALQTLPANYTEICAVDLKQNKRLALLVNVLAALIAIAMAVPALFYVPFSTLYDMSGGIGAYLLRFAVLLISMLAYIVLHELVHGVTMKLFGTKKVRYGFSGPYAFAGSDDYYSKWAYIIIALAPILVWGIALAVILPLVSAEWFWVVYIIQIINISGASGDIYVTIRFLKFPSDILVRDSGVAMKVYSDSASADK